MKKILIAVMGFILANAAYAEDYPVAKVHIKVSGQQNKGYYLCMSNAGGCNRIDPPAQTKPISVETGKVNYIYTASLANGMMYTQPLPASCNVSLAKDETMVITGKLVTKEKNVTIANLHCHVQT